MTWFVIGLIPLAVLLTAIAAVDFRGFLAILFIAAVLGGMFLAAYGAEQMGWIS